MMKQFSVYKNTGKNKQLYPYFIDIQSELLSHLNTRLVMPLAHKNETNSQVKTLSPIVSIQHTDYVVLTTMLTTTSINNLKAEDKVTEAAYLRDSLVSAIDFLVLGI